MGSSTVERNWTGVVSLICGLLASGAAALGFDSLSASHVFTSGCLIDDDMVQAALLYAPVGLVFGIVAIIFGAIGLFGSRRTRGGYRWAGIAGLVLGVIALLACVLLVMAALGGGRANPRYLHPC